MEGSNSKADFEDKKTTFFSSDSVSPCDMNDLDKNHCNDKLQEIDSPYFSFDHFKDNHKKKLFLFAIYLPLFYLITSALL